MNHVHALEDSRDRVLRTLRRAEILHRLRERASHALAQGDVTRCQAILAVLAGMGGPLFAFQVPSKPEDPTRWQPIIERTYCALEEVTKHGNAMLARLNDHLASPRPADPDWLRDVARTIVLQERHVRRQKMAVGLHPANAEAMSP